MRKFIILLCLLVTATSAFAQNTKIRQQKWAICPKFGVSLFDGDITEKQVYSIFPQQSTPKFAAAFTGEYYFLPQLGVIAEYMYLPISSDYAHLKFSGVINSGTAYISANVLNFFAPQRSQRWNLYGNLGIGFSVYDSESTVSKYAPPRKIKGETAFHYAFDVAGEFSISNHFAILWNVQYRFYNKDNFEAMREKQGNSNDGIYVSTIGLKYKFHPNLNNSHYRRYYW